VSESELNNLRQQYVDIVAGMDADPVRAAYHFGRLEVVTKRLLQIMDQRSSNRLG
jgi:hypothetical protein